MYSLGTRSYSVRVFILFFMKLTTRRGGHITQIRTYHLCKSCLIFSVGRRFNTLHTPPAFTRPGSWGKKKKKTRVLGTYRFLIQEAGWARENMRAAELDQYSLLPHGVYEELNAKKMPWATHSIFSLQYTHSMPVLSSKSPLFIAKFYTNSLI